MYLLFVIPLFIAGCSSNISLTRGGESNSASIDKIASASEEKVVDKFVGERGEKMKAEGDIIIINESLVDDNNIHYFNYFSKKENKFSIFNVKAYDGSYRVAVNACEGCYGVKKALLKVAI